MALAIEQLEKAPLTAAVRSQLKSDLANIRETAQRKSVMLDAYDEARETQTGKQHFELGCWLYYYRHLLYSGGVEARIQCARRIFEAGFTQLNYEFFTVFDFGERQFDSIFEMGDSAEVLEGLRQLIPDDKTGNLLKAFKYNGWQLEG